MTLALLDRVQKLRRVPPGRAMQASSNVRDLAARHGYDILLDFTERVAERARHYVGLRHRRVAQRAARGDGEAAMLDRAVDTRTGLIYETARKFAAEQADTPEGRAGAELLRRYFGRGLAAVVKAPFEEALLMVEHMVLGLRGRDAALVETLFIGHHLAAIEALLPRYRAALNVEDKVSASDVAEAYQTLQVAYTELAFALVTFVRDPAHRQMLSAPIFDQDDRLAAIYIARRRGQSIADALDPDAEAEARVAEELEEARAERDEAQLDAEAEETERVDMPFDPIGLMPRSDGDGSGANADATPDARGIEPVGLGPVVPIPDRT